MNKNFNMKVAPISSEPQDIYSATYVLLLINRVLGTAPYALTDPPNRRYEIRPTYIILCFVKIALILAFMWYTILQTTDTGFFGNIKRCADIFFSTLSTIFIIFSIFRAKYIILAFKILTKIDKKFRSLGIWMSYRQIRKMIFSHLVAVVILFIPIAIFEVVLNSDGKDISHYTVYAPQIIILTVEIQYYNYLHLAMCRYKIINEYLDTLEKDNYVFSDVAKRNTVSQSLKDRKLSAGILKTTNVNCNPYLILETVSDLHIQLTDMCTLFNKAFSIQLLFRVGTSLIGIIFSIFYFIVDFQFQYDNNTFNEYSPFWSAVKILICVFCIVELYILARISDKTCQEANNVPLMLHNIKHTCTDPEILDAIELYSIQMYHNKLQFTVCGLFPIDHTLLYSMTGAVTTYLIFLVQFSKSEVFIKMFAASRNNTN